MMRKTAIITAALALTLPLLIASAAQAFSVSSFTGSLSAPGGGKEVEAGGHPDLTTNITFPTIEGETGAGAPEQNVKDIDVTLPAGFVGNPNAVPFCDTTRLEGTNGQPECAPDTQVGVVEITSYIYGPSQFSLPVYNVRPPDGVAGRFGFNVGKVLIFLDSGAVAGGGYHLETKISSISQGEALGATKLTLWGVPASPVHDSQRYKVGGFETGASLPQGTTQLALLRNPTSCTNQVSAFSALSDSWQEPGAFAAAGFSQDEEGNPLVIENCQAVPFSGTISAQPTTHQADSPSGFEFLLRTPQPQGANSIGESDLRAVQVALPEGMTINPASAGGLSACANGAVELGGDNAAQCPEGSKIGAVEITTPLVGHPLKGGVYLARQGENKFGTLLAVYIAVNDPASGTVLKLPGKIATDPRTGNVVAGFDENPQLPFETLAVEFFGGQRAALTTPPACGTYTTTAVLTPWSGNAPVRTSDSFTITSGPDGGPCPNGAFSPSLRVTESSPLAGSYRPLNLEVSRADGTSRLGALNIHLPKGELANLSGIPYCPEATLAAVPTGEGTGAAQLANPSCPAASRVGSVSVGAGSGSSPFYLNTGAIYLAGPYQGAPVSLAIVTPAVAGPFDLGNVVVRAALHVDPETAQVTAVASSLPTMLDGIPLDLRDVRIAIDRKDFTLTPTSCDAESFTGSATSTAGTTAALKSPFGAVGCAGLPFAPKLSLAVRGSTTRGGNPRLTAKVEAPAGEANIGRVTVALPRSEFLAQGHIRTVCTRPEFAAETCPKGSIYGYAVAHTPLLGAPLQGPVYLRSNGGERKLPDLVAALHGQIDIDLVGYIDSAKGGGIRTRFVNVPDAPIAGFELRMKGGKASLLENSTDICRGKHRAKVALAGQNGKKLHLAVPVKARCPRS